MKKGKDGIYARYIKRILDFLIALFALLVLSPLFLLLIFVGLVAMKGNPFFIQKRPGKIDPVTGNETVFGMIKFRTMTNEKDENGELLPSEQRLTSYGRLLRKTSLDELGQLINVLKNDMALIGPRPLLVRYLPLYSAEQHRRHEVLPGLTGLAQISGRNALSWEEKFALDVAYVDNVSFVLDLKILFKTVVSVFKAESVEGTDRVIVEEFKGTTIGESAD